MMKITIGVKVVIPVQDAKKSLEESFNNYINSDEQDASYIARLYGDFFGANLIKSFREEYSDRGLNAMEVYLEDESGVLFPVEDACKRFS